MNRTIRQTVATLAVCVASLASPALSCTAGSRLGPGGSGSTGGAPLPPVDAAMLAPGTFCSLPGSVVWMQDGPRVVGGSQAPGIGWLTLPVGFCAHYFAKVPNARQLRFTPNGDLFVASPTSSTTGGANDGISGVVLLRDADRDGTADANVTFLQGLPAVQGLMVNGGYLYYQDRATIRRVPIQDGVDDPAGPSEVVTQMELDWPQDTLHWPKVFDVTRDGTVYVTNGSTQSETCSSQGPVWGGIFKLQANGKTTSVVRGFRNPIALRCE
ncbi:MAG: hypothetical protein JOZ69_16250, partial [Myxococcales bacterium]|nr:hypothetical protein [Myxococcales bacterium]